VYFFYFILAFDFSKAYIDKCCYNLGSVCMGRRFQSGEGWHSSENPVRFWNP
jgi:hypothetical protein